VALKGLRVALVIGVVVAVAAAAFYWSPLPTPMLPTREIKTPAAALRVEVADTPAARERGLSNHVPLGSAEGMLFVFDTDDRWGIWMKDMHFAIDILWLDAAGKVVWLESNVVPETYPTVFYPDTPARYVLELPANAAEAYDLVVGAQIVL
jgi:uncharacterized protein